MSEEREPETIPDSSEGSTLEWTVRLWQENPSRLWVIVVVAAFAGVIGLWALRHPLGFILGVGMIAMSTADFWMPMHFRLDSEGATRRVGPSVSSILWMDVQRVREDEVGAKLSPLSNPESRLEPFRGIHVRFSGNREAVIERIHREVGGECQISGPTN